MSRYDTALGYFRNADRSVLQRIAEGIEKNRKRDVRVTVNGAGGKEVTVTAEQKSHEFRFGANLFLLDEFETEEKNAEYRRKFPEIFNLGTVPFYWNTLEPEEGHPRFSADSPRIYRRPATDLCVDFCEEKGIEPKCHCLDYDLFRPGWLDNCTVERHKQALETRFRLIAERYADRIPSFEVTNEAFRTDCDSKFYAEPDFLEWNWKTADRYFPDSRLVINDDNIWWPYNFSNRHLYYMAIERMMLKGVTHIDSVGLQYHSYFPLADEPGEAAKRYNPEIMFRLLDTYAGLGLPEQITEMTVPAYSASAEDEDIQAELTKNIYSVFFSYPAMEAVIYWDLVDGYTFGAEPGDMSKGTNVLHGGLLRFDLSEKPVYKTLKKLINEEWHTSVSVPAVNGRAEFRGFCGSYDITVRTQGKERTFRADVSSKRGNEIVLDI